PISFENAGGANAFSYVDVAVLGGCCDQAVNFGGGAGNVLYNVNVDVHNSGATPAVHLYGNAQVAMTGGHIFGRDDTSAIVVEGASSRSPTPRSTTCSTPAPARPSRRCSSPRAAR
ncbi:MAG TPA: hypothetical protein VFF06_02595, partial [Polyangia bacterium]|nr:hypothetical protein [Polyangia bacterium]